MENVFAEIEEKLKTEEIQIKSHYPISGGSINNAFRLNTNKLPLFLKTNHSHAFPEMFEKEERGLQLLLATNTLNVPQVYFTGEVEKESYILMSFHEEGKRKKSFWEDLGRGLAELHRNSNEQFGLDYDNYIGSLVQSNVYHVNWVEFFMRERLEFMLRKAIDEGSLHGEFSRKFEKLFHALDSFFPEENPSLLHGDLWSGNFSSYENGDPLIFDPAVYYGHREMDIAMTKLFGGFAAEFYQSYNNEWPMESGWEDRLDVCNLYPLLVHVILFGGGYVGSIERVLRKFT